MGPINLLVEKVSNDCPKLQINKNATEFFQTNTQAPYKKIVMEGDIDEFCTALDKMI